MVYEVGEATPSPQPSPPRGEGAVSFIVMEHVEGKALSQLGRLPHPRPQLLTPSS